MSDCPKCGKENCSVFTHHCFKDEKMKINKTFKQNLLLYDAINKFFSNPDNRVMTIEDWENIVDNVFHPETSFPDKGTGEQ